MVRRSRVLVATLVLLASCDDKGDEPTTPAEEAKADDGKEAHDAGAKPERKVNHLPPETIDGKMATPKDKPEATAGPLDPEPSADTQLVTLEAKTPAAKGGRLVQNVGVAAMAGRFAPNLAVGCEAPCWQPVPMWPKKPTESTIDFEVFRGKTLLTKDAKALGKFRVTKVPTGARTEVVVGVGVQDGSVVAHAKVRATGVALPLERVER